MFPTRHPYFVLFFGIHARDPLCQLYAGGLLAHVKTCAFDVDNAFDVDSFRPREMSSVRDDANDDAGGVLFLARALATLTCQSFASVGFDRLVILNVRLPYGVSLGSFLPPGCRPYANARPSHPRVRCSFVYFLISSAGPALSFPAAPVYSKCHPGAHGAFSSWSLPAGWLLYHQAAVGAGP